jgi:CheY-like chemotaxis protein
MHKPSRALRVASPTPPTTALRILLADDNEAFRQPYQILLERFGFDVDVAGNGLEVLAAVGRNDYDVVLLDVHMPEMDGLEAARWLTRNRWAGRRPRIVALTGNDSVENRQLCREAGMEDCLEKPIRIERLVAFLHGIGRSAKSNGTSVATAATSW